jgi:hypothetical protein
MARSLGFVLALTLLACSFNGAVGRADIHDSAPADEYFGPLKESILGIRNRLIGYERKADRELLIAGTITGIDNVERGLEDWQHHYPRDPWLPLFMDRVVHIYGRAHALETIGANRCFALLERTYSNTTPARDALVYVHYVQGAKHKL